MSTLRLLVVDDVPIIADGLYDLFQEEQPVALEVFKAYSAPEALRIMQDHPIDIVVSDIKMPEISGLDMLKEINRLWPLCKVIFLTSYHDFDYAREAVIHGGFDFILKTEGDQRILQAVNKAAAEAIRDREAEQLRVKAQAQYRSALPSQQQEFLLELLQGRHTGEATRREQFKALHILFHPTMPVFLTVARIDGWKQSMTWSDKSLLLYSVKNIMHEYLSARVRLYTVNADSSQFIGLWQPGVEAFDEKEYNRAFRFFYGTLETIQHTCRELLRLQVSFIVGAAPAPWEKLGERLQRLELLLQSGIGLNRELLTTDEELRSNHARESHGDADAVDPGVYTQLIPLSALPGLLSSGKRDEFFELFEQLVDVVQEAGDLPSLKLECLHYLAYMFLGFINRRRLLAEVSCSFDLSLLRSLEENPDWTLYTGYCRALAAHLFERATDEQEHRSNRLIQEIQSYIQDHLADDLSLTRLGEQARLNPTYLSRLYKQMTGKGISDDIMQARMEKAKYLLEQSDRKIHEIAEDIGYQSGIAFSRFFKKMMNVTPQEYRDMHNQL